MIPSAQRTALCCLLAACIIGAATRATACDAPPPLQGIEMAFTNKPPELTNDKPSAELAKYQVSTTFAKSHNEVFTLGGLHLSELAPQYIVSFELAEPKRGQFCVAAVAVRVSIEYAPRVMIANEWQPGTCRYKTILDHEMRHVNTDIIAFNEFLPKIRIALEETARKLPQIGPMPYSSVEKAKGILVDAVREKLVAEIDEFQKIRFARQQMIDTRQQYLMESRICAGEK